MKYLFQLGKYAVILPVSLTAFTGYFLYDPRPGIAIIAVTAGVFLMGMAASALNQVQELKQDTLMPRTQKRPLVTGRISTSSALIFSIACILPGSLLIYFTGNIVAAGIALFTIAWYNGIYTPMKKLTAFAVIPGSLTGALPPVIGWTAAGGNITDPDALILAFLFFIGQVPHFWLLVNIYGDEYAQAGMPSLQKHFNNSQVNKLSYIWIISSLVAAFLLVAFNILDTLIFKIITSLLILGGILVFSIRFLKYPGGKQKQEFIFLNIFYLLLMLILIVDKLAAQ